MVPLQTHDEDGYRCDRSTSLYNSNVTRLKSTSPYDHWINDTCPSGLRSKTYPTHIFKEE